MSTSFDILGFGCVAVDDLLYVSAYPPADAKVQVQRCDRQCGGLAATALVAAARLGSRCAYAGTLGDDELSRFVRDCFRREGVDTTYVRNRVGARPIHSVIVVDEARQTRTIFYNLDGVCGTQPGWPSADVIAAARVLFVDHFGIEGTAEVVRVARQACVPVVADFERGDLPGFADLLGLVDHLIVSLDFGRQLTSATDPGSVAAKLWHAGRQTVVLTDGAAGCWYVAAPEPCRLRHQPAFAVKVVDTTGCGDVFHGAYASSLARGLGTPERIRFAAATAALKATQPGGQAGIPIRSVVEAFLQG